MMAANISPSADPRMVGGQRGQPDKGPVEELLGLRVSLRLSL
jgi:hypothetical protein